MPLFDYRCDRCGYQEEILVDHSDRPVMCPECARELMTKTPPAVSFKIKGLRASNGYGLKFEDTYGKSPVNGKETGCSFTSNRGGTVDHKFDQ